MILKEFTKNNDARRLNKITSMLRESFDYELDFDTLTRADARRIKMQAVRKMNESNVSEERIKLRFIAESLDLWMQANVQTELTDMVAEGIDDDAVEGAKVVIAAQELTSKIQGMIEDAAKMQVQDLLPIVDAMKTEIGSSESDAFSNAADSALGQLVDALKQAKSEMDDAIAIAQGETLANDMDDDIDDDMDDFDIDDDIDDDMDDFDMDDDIDDEFSGDTGEIAGDNPTGRELKPEE